MLSEQAGVLGTLAVALLVANPGLSQDWPQWRGPKRDGIVRGAKAPVTWPKALKEEWKVEVGEGVSSPAVVGTSVYLFTRQKEHELVLCLDVASGKEKWRSKPYSAPYQWWAGEGNFSKGPRSTPTVAGGKVYTAGVSGVVSCFDAGTGRALWRKQSRNAPPYGGPASPLVTDGLCIVHLGCDSRGDEDGLTAFDAATGERKWRADDNSRPGSGSPIVVDLAGERQVVAITGWDLLGVSMTTGTKLWVVKLDGPERNSTPVLHKDQIIFTVYRERPRAIRLEKTDKGITPTEVWKGEGPAAYMSTPVLAGDLLFGMSVRRRGGFFCLDAATGKTLWESDAEEGFGYASVVNVGTAWLFLTERGRLVVARPSGKKYDPIAEYQVSDTQTWVHPVFLGDRILIRDQTSLRALAIREDRK